MKIFFKNKYLFKLRNLWKLLRSDAYCLFTLEQKDDSTYWIDTARIKLFTQSQHDVLLNASQLFVNDNLVLKNKTESVLREATELINSKKTT